MVNETFLLVQMLVGFAALPIAARFGKEWVYGIILTNLFLISIFGSKLVSFFGYITNSGNVFYVVVTLAVYFLIERYGRAGAYRSVWFGILGMFFFIVMSQLVLLLESGDTDVLRESEEAMETLFRFVPQIALASVLAYAVSQHFSIWFYSRLKEENKALWLRVLAGNTATQIIDSVLFFGLAYWGSFSFGAFVDIVVVSFLIKVIIGVCGVPMFYISSAFNSRSLDTHGR